MSVNPYRMLPCLCSLWLQSTHRQPGLEEETSKGRKPALPTPPSARSSCLLPHDPHSLLVSKAEAWVHRHLRRMCSHCLISRTVQGRPSSRVRFSINSIQCLSLLPTGTSLCTPQAQGGLYLFYIFISFENKTASFCTCILFFKHDFCCSVVLP